MAKDKAGTILGARSAEIRKDEAKALEMLRKEADERGMTMSEVAQVAVDNLALEDELITITKMAEREKKYVHTEKWEEDLHEGTEAGFNPLDEKHLSDLEALRHAVRGARNLDDGEHSVDIAKSAFKEFSQKSDDHADIASFLWDTTLRDSGVNAGDGYVPEHDRGLTKGQHQLMVNDIDRRKNLAEIEHDSKAAESSTIMEMLQTAKAKLSSFREDIQRIPVRGPEQAHEPEGRLDRNDRDLEL